MCFHTYSLVWVAEWPHIGKKAVHSAYYIVNLVISHLGFRSGNFFLIAPFPDGCLLLLLSITVELYYSLISS